jgi:hypothetical protein
MKTYSKTFKSTLAIATCAIIGVSAYAAVTFDSETGKGFVGKGDVQLVFGWNNDQLQSNASKVEFRYAGTETIGWICEWYTGPAHNRTYHSLDRDTTTSISSSVAYGERRNRNYQITGFDLKEFEDDTVTTGGDKEVGECEGNKTLAEDSIETLESVGTIEVSFDGGEWILLGDS